MPSATKPLRDWLHARLRRTYAESLGKEKSTLNIAHHRKAVANSPLYRLPPELRWAILHFAFGGRIVHLDLVPPDCNGQDQQNLHTYEPHQLRWWSCVCSRDRHDDPSFDWCLLRWGLYPQASRTRTEETFVGAMGWLLSCRQAYYEGVDVLYSSNTIHLASTQLITNMDVVLPSYHRGLITSLKLSCRFGIFKGTQPPEMNEDTEWALFDETLSNIPQLFPSLRYLYLSINHADYRYYGVSPDKKMKALERALHCVDSTVGARARNLTIEIAIPTSLYYAVQNKTKPETHQSPGEQMRGRWLRPVDGDGDANLKGAYWVRLGEDDSPLDEFNVGAYE